MEVIRSYDQYFRIEIIKTFRIIATEEDWSTGVLEERKGTIVLMFIIENYLS
jgi:hypothetical protein